MKSAPTDKEAVIVIENGTVTALAGGPLSLAELGPRKTERASHLTFNSALQEWVVTDAKSNEPLFRSPDYDIALDWERQHYNDLLRQS